MCSFACRHQSCPPVRNYAKTQHTRARKPLTAKKMAKKKAKKLAKKEQKLAPKEDTPTTNTAISKAASDKSGSGAADRRTKKPDGARPYERGTKQPFVSARDRELLRRMGAKAGDFKHDKPWLVYTDEVTNLKSLSFRSFIHMLIDIYLVIYYLHRGWGYNRFPRSRACWQCCWRDRA